VLDDALRNTAPPMASTYADPLNHVLAHEIAHQWAGDQTTLADTYDFVWKEAMAEYLAFVYEDESGRGVGTARLWPAFANGALYHPVPTDDPRPALFDYYGEVYGPGPMILFRQLEVLFTRDQVLDAIAQVLGEAHALSVDELQAALEDTLGVDLDMYFDRWVRGAGAPVWPRFTVDVTGLDTTDVSVTVSQPAPYHGCAFTIRLRGADLADQHDLFFDFGLDGTESVTQSATTTFVVTRYDFNAKGECLAFRETGAARTPLHEPGWTPWRSLH
jgi:aminopeptidase N